MKKNIKKLLYYTEILLLFFFVLFLILLLVDFGFNKKLSFSYRYSRAYKESNFPYVVCPENSECNIKKGDYFVYNLFSHETTGEVLKSVQAGCPTMIRYKRIIGDSILLDQQAENIKIGRIKNSKAIITTYYRIFKATKSGVSRIEFEKDHCMEPDETDFLIINVE